MCTRFLLFAEMATCFIVLLSEPLTMVYLTMEAAMDEEKEGFGSCRSIESVEVTFAGFLPHFTSLVIYWFEVFVDSMIICLICLTVASSGI